YLVISSGSSYNSPFKEGNVVNATRAKHLRHYYDDLCRAKSVLIIGGGLVGVEMAGEICWKYPGKKDITIVHSHEKIIERNPRKAIDYADKFLRRNGVKIIYGERVVGEKEREYETSSGRKLKADLVFLCTGITPNYNFMKREMKKYLDGKNQIVVNDYL